MRGTLAAMVAVFVIASLSVAKSGDLDEPMTRTVTKTCNDAGGWQFSGGRLSVVCIAACNSNETGVYGKEELGVLRDGRRAKGAPTYIYFQSRQLEPPLPVNRWYFYWGNSALNSSSPPKARDFSSMKISIVCQRN